MLAHTKDTGTESSEDVDGLEAASRSKGGTRAAPGRSWQRPGAAQSLPEAGTGAARMWDTQPMLIWGLIALAVLIMGAMALGRRLQQKGRDMEKNRPD